MSYSETPDSQVVLRMSREDYEALLYHIEIAAGVDYKDTTDLKLLMNRLNSGNPNYTPYQVPEKQV